MLRITNFRQSRPFHRRTSSGNFSPNKNYSLHSPVCRYGLSFSLSFASAPLRSAVGAASSEDVAPDGAWKFLLDDFLQICRTYGADLKPQPDFRLAKNYPASSPVARHSQDAGSVSPSPRGEKAGVRTVVKTIQTFSPALFPISIFPTTTAPASTTRLAAAKSPNQRAVAFSVTVPVAFKFPASSPAISAEPTWMRSGHRKWFSAGMIKCAAVRLPLISALE